MCSAAVNELMRNSPLLRGSAARGAASLGSDNDAGAVACQQTSGRGPPSPCKFFILDVSELAQELGLPVCQEVMTSRFPCVVLHATMLW
jgi:hypothetical protein